MPERLGTYGHESHRQYSGSVLKRVIEGVFASLITALLIGIIVSVVKRPKVQISLDPPNSKVLRGDKVRVSWTVDNADDIELSLGTEKLRVESHGSKTVIIREPTQFRITATNGWLKSIFVVPDFLCSEVGSVAVEIIPPPIVKIWAEPAEVVIGEYTTIKWSSSNADQVFIKGIESSQLPVDQGGSQQVKIDKTKTFQIVGLNRADEKTDSFTVRARIPEPKANISADNTDIPVGNNAVISWNCENADSVILKGIDADPITVEPSGSRQIQINESKTFEIVASNQIGKARGSVTVNVYVPELSVSLSVDPKTTVVGGYATLTWNCDNAETVAMDEFGEIPAKGSRQIQVTSSKTYTVVATSSAGMKRATATVNVRSPRVALMGLGYVSEPLKQTIDPSLETFLRSKGYEVAYNPEESNLGNSPNVDYVVQYKVSNPEWKRSHTGLPVVSIDRHTVEVHITISLIRQSDRVQLSTAEGVGKASTKGFQTQYGGYSGSPTSTGKEMEATRKAVSEALKQFTIKV